MGNTIGIVLFEDVEELDFVGPWEVFGVGAMLGNGDRLISVAEHRRPTRGAKGLSFNPDFTFADHPDLDIVVVPGGQGARQQAGNPVLINWLREIGPRCQWITSVCTGLLLLQEAGLAEGKRVTTHWSFVESARARGGVTVLDNCRYVRDGNLLTAAGVSAGIDMALWLAGQLHGADLARQIQRRMEYDPAPPYAAEV